MSNTLTAGSGCFKQARVRYATCDNRGYIDAGRPTATCSCVSKEVISQRITGRIPFTYWLRPPADKKEVSSAPRALSMALSPEGFA